MSQPGPRRGLAPIEAALAPFRHLGVRARLLLALSFIAVFGIGTATLFLISTVVDGSTTSMIAGAQNITTQATEVLNRGLTQHRSRSFAEQVREDRALAAVFSAAITSVPAISYIAVVDEQGVAITHTTPSLQGNFLPPVPEARRLVDEGMIAKLVDLSGKHDYEFVQPVQRGGHRVGSIRVGLSPRLVRGALYKPIQQSLLLVLVALLLAGLLSVALADFITRPLQKLIKALDELGLGNFDQRLETAGADEELDRLFRSFNTMSQRVAEDRTTSEERRRSLTALVDGLEDGVLLVARDGRIGLVNPTACRVLGSPDHELVGRNIEATFGPHHPLSDLWREALDPDGQRERAEVRFDSDARGDHYLLLAYPAPRGREEMSAVVLTIRNTDSLRKLTNLLDESHRMITWGQVALGVAHEIKNPLQAMNLHLELAREKISRTPREPDVQGSMRNLEVVAQQIRRLDEVINGFLRFARMTHAQREPIQLNSILSEVAGLLNGEAERAGTEIQFTPRPGLPTLFGDRALLNQVFLNLLQNAVQAGPHHGPIEMAVEPTNRGVVVRIEDHGKGISRTERGKVFELFFTTRESGSGMGLAIVQRAVQLHSGNIDLQSDDGRGTTVRVTLPLNVPLDQHLVAAGQGEA